jgi:hypothetical protein
MMPFQNTKEIVMKTLIATLAVASILGTSMVAVARDNNASPNDPYVASPTATNRAASSTAFTWAEKRSFDRGTVYNNQ